MRDQRKLHRIVVGTAVGVGLVAVMFGAVRGSAPQSPGISTPTSTPSVPAPATVVVANESILRSCEYNDVAKIETRGVSISDASEVCRILSNRLQHTPSVPLFVDVNKLIFVLRVAGSKDSAKEIAYQTTNFLEYRDQLGNDEAARNSLNALAKVFNGLDGRVSTSDLNQALFAMGPAASKLSDDGIYNLAALILQEKKKNGL